MSLQHLLVDEFVARATQRRFRDRDYQAARDCLRRLGVESGFRSNLDALETRGHVVAAQAATDGVVRALYAMTEFSSRRDGPHAEYFLRSLCFVPRRSALEALLELRSLHRRWLDSDLEAAINTYHDLVCV